LLRFPDEEVSRDGDGPREGKTMSLFSVMDIGSMGLRAQRTRMEIASTNLANANTTRTAEGGPYRRLDPVFVPAEIERSGFRNVLDRQARKLGVEVQKVVRDDSPPNLVYDPDHPDADQDGYVAMPSVNVVEEMVNLMTAARSYEANLSALSLAKQMASRAVEMGH
jgi:flagellar basal-body rod protein FlgC